MKKNSFLMIYPFILAGMFLMLLSSCDKDNDSNNGYNNDNEWIIETILPNGSTGNSPDIVLDNLNRPHISFLDTDDGYVKCAHKNGSSWTIENIGYYGTSTRGAGLNSIAIDAGNNPHISYHDFNNSELIYAYKNSGEWIITSIPMPPDPRNEGYYPWSQPDNSIAVDKNTGVAHISVYLWGSFGGYLGYWNSSLANTVILDYDAGPHNAIALDNNGNPGISYEGAASDLKYAHWNGTSFDIEVVSTMGRVYWEYHLTSLSYDESNNPHIAYYDVGHIYSESNPSAYKYVFKNSSSWTNIPRSTNYNSAYPSLSLCTDSDGKVHIVLQVAMGGGKYNLVHTYYNGSSWKNAIVDKNTTDINNCSITYNNGNIAIVYETDEGAMKYATKSLNKE